MAVCPNRTDTVVGAVVQIAVLLPAPPAQHIERVFASRGQMQAEWTEVVAVVLSLLVQVQVDLLIRLLLSAFILKDDVALLVQHSLLLVTDSRGQRRVSFLVLARLDVLDELGDGLTVDGLVETGVILGRLGEDGRFLPLAV